MSGHGRAAQRIEDLAESIEADEVAQRASGDVEAAEFSAHYAAALRQALAIIEDARAHA